MTNPIQNTDKAENPEKAAQFNAKIKETWSKLNDDDVKLYDAKRDQFFAKLQEKQNVSKEDGEKTLQEIEKSCGAGCGSEKTDNAKAA